MQNNITELNSSLSSFPKIKFRLKDFFNFTDIEYLFKNYLLTLPHENDGLIFTNNKANYRSGTDQNILKWKLPHMNTLDFFLITSQTFGGEELLDDRILELYLMK